MTVRYRYDPAMQLLVVRAAADTDEEALLDYARRLAADGEVPAARDELVDLRAIDASRVSSGGLRRLAGVFEKADAGEPGRVAIVAASDLAFGLSRMYQAFRSESMSEICVFRELEEARRWLGLDQLPGLPEDVG
ncbi:MAG: hypothetical protein R3263_00310 [Myxococcota bacterium]|nr:hypothetical protein [Myxococcota bacterium]